MSLLLAIATGCAALYALAHLVSLACFIATASPQQLRCALRCCAAESR